VCLGGVGGVQDGGGVGQGGDGEDGDGEVSGLQG